MMIQKKVIIHVENGVPIVESMLLRDLHIHI